MKEHFNLKPSTERVMSVESGMGKHRTVRGEISVSINFTEEIILKDAFHEKNSYTFILTLKIFPVYYNKLS
jgi:hypothetical protein